MGVRRITGGALAALALGVGITACGGDDEGTSEDTASATEVTVTTGDADDGFSWDVSPTPTAETESISYVNESKEPHALIFARLSEGFTVDEAYKLQGRKGSATSVAESDEKTSPGPGETVTIDVTEDIEPGNYVLLCPIPGNPPHYQQGQLDEFEIG